MPKQKIQSQTPGGQVSTIEVDMPTIKSAPDPTWDAGGKTYDPEPSRKERKSFGLNEGDQG